MANIAVLSFYSGIVDRGVEAFVYEISKRLKVKHQLSIFQAGEKIQNPQIKTYLIKSFADIPKSSKSVLSKFYLDWQSIKILIFSLQAISKIISGKYQVIILMNGGWQTVIYRIVSKLTNAKIIISGQAGIGSDDAFNLLFRPDTFVSLTTSQLKWAQNITPEVNAIHIPNGVNLAVFNPEVKPINISLKTPIVVCASALVPNKRVDLTIRAVAKNKNMSLLLLGDGQLAGNLDTLGKRLLSKRYLRVLTPYVEMPKYYRAGDVFTLASKNEAFGISYIEAMACNLPVVTTNDDSRQEIIGNAGILTDPVNINQYARDLSIAVKTNYRNIPYDQALKFSWNNIAKKYSRLINELIKK